MKKIKELVLGIDVMGFIAIAIVSYCTYKTILFVIESNLQ